MISIEDRHPARSAYWSCPYQEGRRKACGEARTSQLAARGHQKADNCSYCSRSSTAKPFVIRLRCVPARKHRQSSSDGCDTSMVSSCENIVSKHSVGSGTGESRARPTISQPRVVILGRQMEPKRLASARTSILEVCGRRVSIEGFREAVE